MKKFIICLALMFFASTVHAQSILGSFLRKGTAAPIFNTLDDVDGEYIIKGDGNTGAAFEVGDTIVQLGQFQNITSSDAFYFNTDLDDASAGGPGYTLFFRAEATIESIVDDDGDGVAECINWNPVNVEVRENDDGVDFDFSGIDAVEAVFAAADLVTIFQDSDTDDYLKSIDAPLNFSDIVDGAEVNSFLGLTETFVSDLDILQDFVTNPNGPNTDPDLYKHATFGNNQARNFRIGVPPVIGDDEFDLNSDTELTVACILRADICGYKWNDLNGNCEWDADEPGLEDWEINLDGTDFDGNEVSRSTETDEFGAYCFTDLLPGDYTVSEKAQDGWVQSYPDDGHQLSVVGGDIVQGGFEMTEPPNFGNYKYGQIYGYKWNDEDAEGDWDEAELGLEGWEINLDGTDGKGDPVNLSTFTDVDGAYCFMQVPPGVYTVSEKVQDGWVQTYPPDPGFHEITIISCQTVEGAFGFAEPPNFGNYVIEGECDARTIGFWGNRHGLAIIGELDCLDDLAALNLRNQDGSDFDPTTLLQWRAWLRGANAENMAYMLSAQMGGMFMNIKAGFVGPDDMVVVDGELLDISDVIDAANEVLGLDPIPDGDGLLELVEGHPDAEQPASDYVTPLAPFGEGTLREYAGFLKNILDDGNNNLNWEHCNPPAKFNMEELEELEDAGDLGN